MKHSLDNYNSAGIAFLCLIEYSIDTRRVHADGYYVRNSVV